MKKILTLTIAFLFCSALIVLPVNAQSDGSAIEDNAIASQFLVELQNAYNAGGQYSQALLNNVAYNVTGVQGDVRKNHSNAATEELLQLGLAGIIGNDPFNVTTIPAYEAYKAVLIKHNELTANELASINMTIDFINGNDAQDCPRKIEGCSVMGGIGIVVGSVCSELWCVADECVKGRITYACEEEKRWFLRALFFWINTSNSPTGNCCTPVAAVGGSGAIGSMAPVTPGDWNGGGWE